MNSAIERMLSRYPASRVADREMALREILQEVVLVALNRSGFFEKGAFYGGTALRILYGLDRFSEDLDFTLIVKTEDFSWEHYAKTVEEELRSFGFIVSMSEKRKSHQTAVKSAFLKANTFQELMNIGVPRSELHGLHPDTTIRIKVEIDTMPLIEYQTEERYLREPLPTSIRCVTEESLFAGKMHATLFRQWKNRVKGRDWYDMVWFIRRNIPLNLALFSQIMGEKEKISPDAFRQLAKSRIDSLDIESAKVDIRVYVRDVREIESWSKKFFFYWIDQLIFS